MFTAGGLPIRTTTDVRCSTTSSFPASWVPARGRPAVIIRRSFSTGAHVKRSQVSARHLAVALATAVAAVVPLAGVSAPASLGATGKAAAPGKTDTSVIVPGRYIVLTKGMPLAGYRGSVRGIPRTK